MLLVRATALAVVVIMIVVFVVRVEEFSFFWTDAPIRDVAKHFFVHNERQWTQSPPATGWNEFHE